MPRNPRRGGHSSAARTGGSAREKQPVSAPLTDEQHARVEALLAEVPALAQRLRASVAAGEGRDALLAALAPITQEPEPVALVFAERLGSVRG
ncbi:MAG: hypothetical protein ACHQ4H_05885, partial [Ktedonobacterales bacterium]